VWETNETNAVFRTLSAYPLARFFLTRGGHGRQLFQLLDRRPDLHQRVPLDGLNTGAEITSRT